MASRIFAIADLHLSLAVPKPMDIFGPAWADHVERVRNAWIDTVQPDDIVLVAGDVSWAMRLEDAIPDLEWLASLPGHKVMIRGNHDYWWQSIGKLRAWAPAGMHFVQNDAVTLGHVSVAGTRLWDFPEVLWPAQSDRMPTPDSHAPRPGTTNGGTQPVDAAKIRARECQRLQQSLSRLAEDARLRVALLHFPPVGADGQPTPITDIMDAYRVDVCVYGHLHALGPDPRPGADCHVNKTHYLLTSCDWLQCRPLLITE